MTGPQLPASPKYPWLAAAWSFCTTKLVGLTFKAVELLTVLGVFLVSTYAAWFLVTRNANDATRQRMVSLLETVNANWKALALLAVLDGQNLALFKGGQRYTYAGGLANQQQHRQELTVPYPGIWYLVIVNYLAMPTAVHYNVWLG